MDVLGLERGCACCSRSMSNQLNQHWLVLAHGLLQLLGDDVVGSVKGRRSPFKVNRVPRASRSCSSSAVFNLDHLSGL